MEVVMQRAKTVELEDLVSYFEISTESYFPNTLHNTLPYLINLINLWLPKEQQEK